MTGQPKQKGAEQKALPIKSLSWFHVILPTAGFSASGPNIKNEGGDWKTPFQDFSSYHRKMDFEFVNENVTSVKGRYCTMSPWFLHVHLSWDPFVNHDFLIYERPWSILALSQRGDDTNTRQFGRPQCWRTRAIPGCFFTIEKQNSPLILLKLRRWRIIRHLLTISRTVPVPAFSANFRYFHRIEFWVNGNENGKSNREIRVQQSYWVEESSPYSVDRRLNRLHRGLRLRLITGFRPLAFQANLKTFPERKLWLARPCYSWPSFCMRYLLPTRQRHRLIFPHQDHFLSTKSFS